MGRELTNMEHYENLVKLPTVPKWDFNNMGHYQCLVGVSMGLDDGLDSETEYINVGHYNYFVAVELYDGVDNILTWEHYECVLWLSQWDFMMG